MCASMWGEVQQSETGGEGHRKKGRGRRSERTWTERLSASVGHSCAIVSLHSFAGTTTPARGNASELPSTASVAPFLPEPCIGVRFCLRFRIDALGERVRRCGVDESDSERGRDPTPLLLGESPSSSREVEAYWAQSRNSLAISV